jgi:hypothetical protein
MSLTITEQEEESLSGVVVPTVGWKQTPFLVIASRFLVFDKYFHTLCT